MMWVNSTHHKEDGMPTDELIIRLFCMVDDQLGNVNKRSDAHLYPSEIVTIGLLFSLKGGRFRAFYRGLDQNYRAWFPALPERTRLRRLARPHARRGPRVPSAPRRPRGDRQVAGAEH